MTEHTVKSYSEQLDLLKKKVISMGQLTHEQLKSALDAVERLDAGLARRIIEREPQANHMEHEIDELITRELLAKSPVCCLLSH